MVHWLALREDRQSGKSGTEVKKLHVKVTKRIDRQAFSRFLLCLLLFSKLFKEAPARSENSETRQWMNNNAK